MRIYQTFNGETYIANSYVISFSNDTGVSTASARTDIATPLTALFSSGSTNNLAEAGQSADFFGNTFSFFNSAGSTTDNNGIPIATGSSSSSSGVDTETFELSYNPSTTTSTTVNSSYTTTESVVATYTSGTTSSIGGNTTFTSTTTTSIFLASNVTTTISTWALTEEAFTTVTGLNMGAQIGTVYECESPFEVIWAYNSGIGAGDSEAFTQACSSYSIYTLYGTVPGTTAFPYDIAYSSISSAPPAFTLTFGGPSFSAANFEQTFTPITATLTISKSVNGTADIPYSTQTVIFVFSSNIGLSNFTYSLGDSTFTATNVQSQISTLFEETTREITYTRVSNNGITSITAQDTSSSLITWAYTTVEGFYRETALTASGSNSNSITTVAGLTSETLQAASFSQLSSSIGRTDVLTIVTNSDNIYIAFASSNAQGDSVVMRDLANGIVSFSTSINLSNSIYENYSLAGAFTYIYYPWKSTALPDSNEVYVTFEGPRQASYSDSSSRTFNFNYVWNFDSLGQPSNMNVTESQITSFTTTVGTRTLTKTSTVGTTTGTVSIGDQSAQATTNLYSFEQDIPGTNSVVRVGGYGVNRSIPATCELWQGIYNSTGYTYSTDGALSSSSTGSTEVSGYEALTISSNVMSIIAQELILTNDQMGPGEPVNTFNNSGEMP